MVEKYYLCMFNVQNYKEILLQQNNNSTENSILFFLMSCIFMLCRQTADAVQEVGVGLGAFLKYAVAVEGVNSYHS